MKTPCKGTTKSGTPCKAAAWANGFCIAHQDEETRRKAGHKSGTRDGSVRDPLRVPALAKTIVEANAAAILYPYFAALGMKLMRHKPTGQVVAVMDPNRRAKLYGTSKDGVVVMSRYEDLEAMMRATERLIDRVYGRPKQALMLGSEEGVEPVEVRVSADPNRASEVAQILARTGAISTASRN